MAIEIVLRDNLFCPHILCDQCGERIDAEDLGHVEWAMSEGPGDISPIPGTVRFLHKACHRRYKKANPGHTWYWEELEAWLKQLEMNALVGPRNIARAPLGQILEGHEQAFNVCGNHVYIVIRTDGPTDEVLYVGKTTVSVRNRLQQHWFAASALGKAIDGAAPESYDWVVELLQTKHDLVKLERDTIYALKPILNKVHNHGRKEK